MKTLFSKTIFCLLVPMFALLFVTAGASAAPNVFKTYTIEGEFADVLQDVEDSIINAGLNIDYRGHIATMLERTGKDIGADKKIYKGAEFLQFCSARLSREMMEADAGNIGVCPYIVFVYETMVNPGKVIIGYKRPIGAAGEASQKALGKIEALLDGIVREVAEQ